MSHPLHQFTYCPKCGARTFVERNEKAKQCTTCGFVYYFNPSSAVACFIRNSKGELLLVRRAKEPAKGTLDLPGGFVDMYESAEDAAHREVKEETGLDVTNITYFGNQAWPYPSGLMVGVHCRLCRRGNQVAGGRTEFRRLLHTGQLAGTSPKAEPRTKDDRLVAGMLSQIIGYGKHHQRYPAILSGIGQFSGGSFQSHGKAGTS